MSALLALHAVRGGGSAVPAASGSGRAVERHGRALRLGQLGVRRGLPAEPDWGALLLPARHPALDARCDSCSKRGGGVWGGMRGGVLVGQQHCIVRSLRAAARQRVLGRPVVRYWTGILHLRKPLTSVIQCSPLSKGINQRFATLSG